MYSYHLIIFYFTFSHVCPNIYHLRLCSSKYFSHTFYALH